MNRRTKLLTKLEVPEISGWRGEHYPLMKDVGSFNVNRWREDLVAKENSVKIVICFTRSEKTEVFIDEMKCREVLCSRDDRSKRIFRQRSRTVRGGFLKDYRRRNLILFKVLWMCRMLLEIFHVGPRRGLSKTDEV